MAAKGDGHSHPSLKVTHFTPFDPATKMAEAIAVVGGGENPHLNGAFPAEASAPDDAGGALRQLATRTKSFHDRIGWPRKPIVADITVADG
jgi:hypothetical protein